MLIRFEVAGESPEIGEFEAGDDRIVPESIAKVFIDRKMAVEVKPSKPASAKAVKEEVKDNGRD